MNKAEIVEDLLTLMLIDTLMDDGVEHYQGTDIMDAVSDLNLDAEFQQVKVNIVKTLLRGTYLNAESIKGSRNNLQDYLKALNLSDEQKQILGLPDGKTT